MAIVKYRDVVQDAAGNAIVGAAVTILGTGTATPSTLYEDDEVTPLANPLTTDATGNFEFSIEEGEYDISVAITGYTTVVQDRVSIGSAGGGGGAGNPYIVVNSLAAVPASATGTEALAIGDGAIANGNFSAAVGEDAEAVGAGAIAVGSNAEAIGDRCIAIGLNSDARATEYAMAVGWTAQALHNSSTAIGAAATTTKDNQVVLGTVAEEVFVPGRLVTTPLAVTVADSTSATLDLSLGEYFKMNATGNVAFTLTAPSPTVSNRVLAATLDLTKTTGTITYVTTILWDSGTAPDLSATGRYIIEFLSPDDGTTWLGFAAGSGMATV